MRPPILANRDFAGQAAFLRDHLLKEILPFWLRHAMDPDDGGINTCIADDGSLLNREKWLWSQWRAVWVFSRLHRQLPEAGDWLATARSIFHCARRGWLEAEDGWALLLGPDGSVLRGCESLYVDGFALYGLTEYLAATGDPEAEALARATAEAVLRKLKLPHDQIPHFPYPVPPGARVHGLPMMFSLIFWELGLQLGEEPYRRAALDMAEEIFSRFYDPERDLVLERISADGSPYPPPLGTAVIPGHVIEDMWFQIHIARDREDWERVRLATRLIRRHLERGWDTEAGGGILLAVDADGGEEIGWKFADSKLWWPHTEALYALLLAHEHSGEPWCLEWYDRVADYSFEHFPVEEHGEWRQKLDRHGKPFAETVALPVKDPFHLPRALLLCIETLDRQAAGAG